MKFTLFIATLVTLSIGINATSYQQGFITGMIVEKAYPSKKAEIQKFNMVIIDTALIEFPKDKTPTCRPIQVKETKYIKSSPIITLISFIIMVLFINAICNSCNNDPEFADFMLGYLLGQMIEHAFSNDD